MSKWENEKARNKVVQPFSLDGRVLSEGEVFMKFFFSDSSILMFERNEVDSLLEILENGDPQWEQKTKNFINSDTVSKGDFLESGVIYSYQDYFKEIKGLYKQKFGKNLVPFIDGLIKLINPSDYNVDPYISDCDDVIQLLELWFEDKSSEKKLLLTENFQKAVDARLENEFEKINITKEAQEYFLYNKRIPGEEPVQAAINKLLITIHGLIMWVYEFRLDNYEKYFGKIASFATKNNFLLRETVLLLILANKFEKMELMANSLIKNGNKFTEEIVFLKSLSKNDLTQLVLKNNNDLENMISNLKVKIRIN